MKEQRTEETIVHQKFTLDNGETYETRTKIIRESGNTNGLEDALTALLGFGLAGSFLAVLWVLTIKVTLTVTQPQQQLQQPQAWEAVWKEQKR